MSEHARLSPSAAHRWLHCTPSIKLEEQFDDQPSVFAEEGTAAHVLGEWKLRMALGSDAGIRPVSPFDSEEMEQYTDDYRDFCLEQIEEAKRYCKDAVVLIERRVEVDHYATGVFGTADLLIVADEWLTVIDLKYGKGVEVYAEENPQMMIYALGALELLGMLYNVRNVRMVIYQPRLSNISFYEADAKALIEWGNAVLRPKAELASQGEGEFCPGTHCRFCKARFTCRARAEENLQTARFEFRKPDLLTDEEIAEVLTKARELASWAEDVFLYAEQEALHSGKQWPGYKLVEGRSRRRYTDETVVGETLRAAGFFDIYKQSLLGIGEMEKKLGKNVFRELLQHLIEKPDGAPTLVPENDKREALNRDAAAKNDFLEE